MIFVSNIKRVPSFYIIYLTVLQAGLSDLQNITNQTLSLSLYVQFLSALLHSPFCVTGSTSGTVLALMNGPL